MPSTSPSTDWYSTPRLVTSWPASALSWQIPLSTRLKGLGVRHKLFYYIRTSQVHILARSSMVLTIRNRFVGADALWTLAMAINVYLAFYHRFDAQRLRKME